MLCTPASQVTPPYEGSAEPKPAEELAPPGFRSYARLGSVQPALALVAGQAAVPIASVFAAQGRHITHHPGSPNVFLAPGATYFVVYTVHGVPPPARSLSAQLWLDDQPLAGSEAVHAAAHMAVQATGSAVFHLPRQRSLVRLAVYHTSGSNVLLGLRLSIVEVA